MKKIFPLLLLLALLLSSCTQDPGAFRRAYDPWGQTEREEKPVEASKPVLSQQPTLQPLPTHTARASEPRQVVMAPGEIAATLKFSKEDIEYFKTLWALKKYSMKDIGEFYDLFVYVSESYFSITYWFISDEEFKDVKKKMQGCIKGEWNTEQGSVYIDEGISEGNVRTGCKIFDQNGKADVSVEFYLDGKFYESESILDSHWPAGAFEIPDGLSGEPVSRCAGIDAETIYLSYDWEIPGYRDVFEQLREGMAGQAGYKYSNTDEYEDEVIEFYIGNINVTIGLDDTYGGVGITYFLSGNYDSLF